MEHTITLTIQNYLDSAPKDDYHRYHSWDHCRKVFNSTHPTGDLAINLGFYLASWGMYRGSGGLLQRNHTIHQGTVDIYYSGKFDYLKCNESIEVSEENIPHILTLRDEIASHYQGIEFKRGNDALKSISTTDTLMSKIMLGTFGCVPAYDDFFVKGLKESGIKKRKFNDQGLNEIFKFYRNNQEEIEYCIVLIKSVTGNYYPVMKIIDMHFWQLGYSIYLEESALNKGKKTSKNSITLENMY